MSGDRDLRRAPLDERLRAQRGRRFRDDVADEVDLITGVRPTLDEFLSAEATDRLAELYLSASRTPDVQRQAWTTDLEDAVRAALIAAAEDLVDVTAYWLHPRARDVGAVRVSADGMLRHAARTFAAGDHDLVLVDDRADSGLRLAWDHLPEADEYELLRWGAYRAT